LIVSGRADNGSRLEELQSSVLRPSSSSIPDRSIANAGHKSLETLGTHKRDERSSRGRTARPDQQLSFDERFASAFAGDDQQDEPDPGDDLVWLYSRSPLQPWVVPAPAPSRPSLGGAAAPAPSVP